jgi:hypothetical protein
MATTPKTEKIFIGINDQVIELTGKKHYYLKRSTKPSKMQENQH